MVRISMEYQGDLRSVATHEPSGNTLITDAPKDNHGKGESFSPTDLLATALGTCMLSIMGILASRLKIDITGTTATVDKEMITAPIRKVGKLTVHIHGRGGISVEHQKQLEVAALACPVHRSIHPDVQMPIEFHWPD